MKYSKRQENVYKTFYYEHDMHSTTQTRYTTQKWEVNMKTCIVGIIQPKTNKTHSSNSTKYP